MTCTPSLVLLVKSRHTAPLAMTFAAQNLQVDSALAIHLAQRAGCGAAGPAAISAAALVRRGVAHQRGSRHDAASIADRTNTERKSICKAREAPIHTQVLIGQLQNAANGQNRLKLQCNKHVTNINTSRHCGIR